MISPIRPNIPVCHPKYYQWLPNFPYVLRYSAINPHHMSRFAGSKNHHPDHPRLLVAYHMYVYIYIFTHHIISLYNVIPNHTLSNHMISACWWNPRLCRHHATIELYAKTLSGFAASLISASLISLAARAAWGAKSNLDGFQGLYAAKTEMARGLCVDWYTNFMAIWWRFDGTPMRI